MITFVSVILKEIFEQGRKYVWERPATCANCNHYKVWSHGFVERLFDGFDTFLLLKCYRCPNCGCVITLRPDSHFARIQASKETIRSSLYNRLQTGRWPPGLSGLSSSVDDDTSDNSQCRQNEKTPAHLSTHHRPPYSGPSKGVMVINPDRKAYPASGKHHERGVWMILTWTSWKKHGRQRKDIGRPFLKAT